MICQMWVTKDMYVKVIDRYYEQLVSAYVTPSNMHNFLSISLKPTQSRVDRPQLK
jgi:Sedlin, N-terminal conserved region